MGPRGLLLQGLRAVRGARHGLGDCSHIMRVRTGMACVLCWSFSLVGAGSSARAWPGLVCWLLILIRAGSSAPGAQSGRDRVSLHLACENVSVLGRGCALPGSLSVSHECSQTRGVYELTQTSRIKFR